jgi:hypothetical protein
MKVLIFDARHLLLQIKQILEGIQSKCIYGWVLAT